MIIMAIFIGIYAGWGQKMPLPIKILIPIFNLLVCLIKTILSIPIMQAIFICFSPSNLASLNIEMDPNILMAIGAIALIAFCIVVAYIIGFFR